MKRNQEEYISQFCFDDNEFVNKEICKCCNREMPSYALDSTGYCIECVMNNVAYENKDAHPNELLYKKFSKSERKNILKDVLCFLFLPTLLLNEHFNKPCNNPGKSVSFKKGNRTTVYIRNYKWVCPCCKLENQGPHYCKQCGVYPKFKLID